MTLVHQNVIIDEEKVVRRELVRKVGDELLAADPNLVPADAKAKAKDIVGKIRKIVIIDNDIGVGSSIDVEEIRPQICLLEDAADLRRLRCDVGPLGPLPQPLPQP